MAAELVLSPIIEVLVEKVAAFLDDQSDLYSDVKEKLENVKTALEKIQSVASAADEVEIDKIKNLVPWLRELRACLFVSGLACLKKLIYS